MPKVRLTAKTVENAKAPASGQVEYFDEALPGFALRVTHKGKKSWVIFYRPKSLSGNIMADCIASAA